MQIRSILNKTLLVAVTIISFTACVNPGKEVKFNNKNKIYVKDGATEDDAKKFGSYLQKMNYFSNDEKERAVQLLKKDNDYIANFVVDTVYLKQHPELYASFKALESDFSTNVFGGSKVVVNLVDPSLKEVKQQ